ncbi:MAG: conjugal transfer protein TraD [Sphingomonadaceae bacterium]|nr:conjugal transfer protein TraD [Sphingomonadaceae bacterium]
MSAPNTYSDVARPGKLTHHSGRGTMPRNAGNFTRGSQLITHEFLMWFSSARLPLLFWLIVFALVFAAALALKLREYEIQMILMKIYAAGWLFMEFNPGKIINLTVASGEVLPAPIGMVASHPDVVAAWGRFMRCFWGSLFISLFVSLPLSYWFIVFSKKRGQSILEERHQRGAMLTDAPELTLAIRRHNAALFSEEARQLFPDKTVDQVAALPAIERKAAGLHSPYTLARIPYPWRDEQSHTMMIGTTGTGKTTQMRDMLAQVRKHRDRAVVFDLTGAFVEAFYNPETDVILNPMDRRCPTWTLFDEAHSHADFTNIAAAILPVDGGASEPFWILAARTLFVETCMKLVKDGKATNQALASKLMMADLKAIHKLLENTVADPLTAPEAARMAESIRAVFNTNAQALRFLPEDNPRFAITDWIRDEDNPGGILFITSSHNELTLNRSLLTLWMNIAVHTLMRLPRTRSLRTWFFFDEVHALHRLPAIEEGLTTARGFGGAFVLGIHSFAKLAETYGREGAVHLNSLARTKLVLATADRETAEHCSNFIGQREVRMMDEAYSYGFSNIRDAATITPRSEIQPLVIPDDIMKLPNLHGFVVFPQGFDAARIKLTYIHYPVIAPGYDLRENVEPLGYVDVDGDARKDGEAGGREAGAAPENAPSDKDAAAAVERAQADLAPDKVAPEQPTQEAAPADPQADQTLYQPERFSPEQPALPDARPASDKAEHDIAKPKQPAQPSQRQPDLAGREAVEPFEAERKTGKAALGDKGPGSDTPEIADDGELGI